ncbi:hypothetical protein EV356DRAFT_506377 [Viridothelium virens]|uniref:Uncharacterized protein n=1 Tax=Viridothelium virens TaxID=1048519 RepID=A0A6A6H1J9_VIRVR|nr:hypothetical protein EV356DRAFT_506377 [Viridothelium virens]
MRRSWDSEEIDGDLQAGHGTWIGIFPLLNWCINIAILLKGSCRRSIREYYYL